MAFREAAHPSFKEYAHQIVVNAAALAEALAGEGFRLVSGGTDTHMMVVDLRPFDAELTGKVAQTACDAAGITLNKNTIPDDPRSPFVTSGLRIGTPSVTTQGMQEPEMGGSPSSSLAPSGTATTPPPSPRSAPRWPTSAPSSPPTPPAPCHRIRRRTRIGDTNGNVVAHPRA